MNKKRNMAFSGQISETFSESDEKRNTDENQKRLDCCTGFGLNIQSKHYKYKQGGRTRNKKEKYEE